jgi:hypothetical protein
VRLRKDGDVGHGQLQGAAALLLRDETWRGVGGDDSEAGGCLLTLIDDTTHKDTHTCARKAKKKTK